MDVLHDLPSNLPSTSLALPLAAFLYSSSEHFLLHFRAICLCPTYWKNPSQITLAFQYLSRQLKTVYTSLTFPFAERLWIVYSLYSLFSVGHNILALLWTASIIVIQVGCQSWIKYCNWVYQDLQKTEYLRLQVCFHRPHDTDADYSLLRLTHYNFRAFSEKTLLYDNFSSFICTVDIPAS